MGVGTYSIGLVKTNIKVLFKDTIEKLTNNWSGGSYLMLKRNHMVPGDRPLISIGYKYNMWNVISLVVT